MHEESLGRVEAKKLLYHSKLKKQVQTACVAPVNADEDFEKHYVKNQCLPKGEILLREAADQRKREKNTSEPARANRYLFIPTDLKTFLSRSLDWKPQKRLIISASSG